jgi:hypothetical protein
MIFKRLTERAWADNIAYAVNVAEERAVPFKGPVTVFTIQTLDLERGC